MTTYIQATTLHMIFACISLLLSSRLPVEDKVVTDHEQLLSHV